MKRPIRKLWQATLVLIGCCLMVSAWAQSLTIIDLQHRRADEVIPALQPLLEPGGALSGSDYKLFVRASAANLSQLRQALAVLDRAPSQLRVSVRSSTRAEIDRERLSSAATVRSGNASIGVNEPPRADAGVTVRATAGSQRSASDGIASVLVLEGNAAYIASGESVPIVTAVVAGGGNRPWLGAQMSYRDLNSGFLVTPRLVGGNAGTSAAVMLEIEQRSARRSDRTSANIDTQSLTTTVSGRLGEWIALGGIEQSATVRGSATLDRRYATSSDSKSIWVMVESVTK